MAAIVAEVAGTEAAAGTAAAAAAAGVAVAGMEAEATGTVVAAAARHNHVAEPRLVSGASPTWCKPRLV